MTTERYHLYKTDGKPVGAQGRGQPVARPQRQAKPVTTAGVATMFHLTVASLDLSLGREPWSLMVLGFCVVLAIVRETGRK